MNHVPFSGGSGQLTTALVGNTVGIGFDVMTTAMPQVRAGTLRPLGAMGDKRVASFPEVPTLKELGYDAQYYQWNGLFTQAKVPEPIITILREAVAKAVKDPHFAEAMTKMGTSIDYLDRDAFRPWWDEDSRKTEDTVRAIGKVQ